MHLFKLYKKIDGNNTATIVAPVELSNLQSLSTFVLITVCFLME